MMTNGAPYRLLTYRDPRGPRAGLAVGDSIVDVADASGDPAYATVLGVLADWDAARPRLSEIAANARGTALAGVTLLAPVLYPSAIYCAGANYQDHVDEMARARGSEPAPDPHTLGLGPWHFVKPSRCVVGPGVDVAFPAGSEQLDWEVELVAVVGRTARNVPVERALDYVAGYTIANDLSARDLGRRPPTPPTSPFHHDWLAHKCFDGSCPLGPWIVPADAVGDPQRLGIKLWVNDVLKQDSETSRMIFSIAEQIAQLSARLTLHPGDLVLTGTPAGVGAGRGEFLRRGDVLRLWCEGIGELTHRVT
jgi:2-keto-4-pentenoate hydratase/2-oxohepta-3-ene-1,7-dioic acid hydratase in catechol pathway